MTGSKKIGIPRTFCSALALSRVLAVRRLLELMSRYLLDLAAEIAARIRAGEEVSGEEITAALDKIRQDQEDAERELIEEEARRVKAEEKAANKRGGNQTRRRVQK